jgi:osmoprotectant transport system permease protein
MDHNMFQMAWNFTIAKYDVLLAALGTQLYLVFLSSVLTTVIGIPLGIALHRLPKVRTLILKIIGALYTIPILAMFGLLIPFFGTGTKSALISLTIYGILPILYNTYAGINGVSPGVKEAARGMGVNDWQMLTKVELPLALPVIIGGIKTSIVLNISVATYAAFIGAGGLGMIIIQGMRTFHEGMLLVGTLLVAAIAILAERLLMLFETKVTNTMKGLHP